MCAARRRCTMPIENRRLEPGTKLVAKYKGEEHTAEVIAAKEGAVRYRLADGREFRSPSAAGKAVMGGVACNGWRFWSLGNGGASTDAPRAHTGADSAPQAGRSPTPPPPPPRRSNVRRRGRRTATGSLRASRQRNPPRPAKPRPRRRRASRPSARPRRASADRRDHGSPPERAPAGACSRGGGGPHTMATS